MKIDRALELATSDDIIERLVTQQQAARLLGYTPQAFGLAMRTGDIKLRPIKVFGWTRVYDIRTALEAVRGVVRPRRRTSEAATHG